jgi:uncharacterized protein (DUF1778 family)
VTEATNKGFVVGKYYRVTSVHEAADLSGATLSHFVVQAALEKAQAIIDRERTIRFTSKDAALLINMLDAPIKPNQALTRAFKRYNDKGTNEKSLSSVNKEQVADILKTVYA